MSKTAATKGKLIHVYPVTAKGVHRDELIFHDYTREQAERILGALLSRDIKTVRIYGLISGPNVATN